MYNITSQITASSRYYQCHLSISASFHYHIFVTGHQVSAAATFSADFIRRACRQQNSHFATAIAINVEQPRIYFHVLQDFCTAAASHVGHSAEGQSFDISPIISLK